MSDIRPLIVTVTYFRTPRSEGGRKALTAKIKL